MVKFRAHLRAGTSSGSVKSFPFEDLSLSLSLLKIICVTDALWHFNIFIYQRNSSSSPNSHR